MATAAQDGGIKRPFPAQWFVANGRGRLADDGKHRVAAALVGRQRRVMAVAVGWSDWWACLSIGVLGIAVSRDSTILGVRPSTYEESVGQVASLNAGKLPALLRYKNWQQKTRSLPGF